MMATYDLATLVAEIKAGKTSIDVLSAHRDIAQNKATRIQARITAMEGRLKSFQAKLDRADAHIADPDIDYYLVEEDAFMERKDGYQEQITLLEGHITSDTANLTPYLDELELIDAELGPMRRGDMS